MVDFGAAPAADEIEVTLFGPGLGEAIAVHLGEGQWLLVDSCEEKKGAGPVTGGYLDALGVGPDGVLAILTTHWHNDHIRGVSSLAKKYATASVYISAALRSEEARNVLMAYGGSTAPGQANGTNEMHNLLLSRPANNKAKLASAQTSLIDKVINGLSAKVYALSPLPESYHKAIAHMAQYVPSKSKPINNAPPEPSPNAAAVVLHISIGEDAILLGADLEDNKAWGWSAMTSDPWVMERNPASAYKIAHHGSRTGEADCIWDNLLLGDPVSLVSPFICGRHRLPTDADRDRIRGRSGAAFISSDASRQSDIPADQLKRLRAICADIKKMDTATGAVRARKKLGSAQWSVELFGAAKAL